MKREKLTKGEIEYIIQLIEKDTRDFTTELLQDVYNGVYDEDEQRKISKEIFHREANNHQIILKLQRILAPMKFRLKLFNKYN